MRDLFLCIPSWTNARLLLAHPDLLRALKDYNIDGITEAQVLARFGMQSDGACMFVHVCMYVFECMDVFECIYVCVYECVGGEIEKER
jgi:hypothetical protein